MLSQIDSRAKEHLLEIRGNGHDQPWLELFKVLYIYDHGGDCHLLLSAIAA